MVFSSNLLEKLPLPAVDNLIGAWHQKGMAGAGKLSSLTCGCHSYDLGIFQNVQVFLESQLSHSLC